MDEKIYETILNEELIQTNGEKIYNRGGSLVMQANYYTFIEVLKDMIENTDMKHHERIEIFYPIKERINDCWDGVGEWRH